MSLGCAGAASSLGVRLQACKSSSAVFLRPLSWHLSPQVQRRTARTCRIRLRSSSSGSEQPPERALQPEQWGDSASQVIANLERELQLLRAFESQNEAGINSVASLTSLTTPAGPEQSAPLVLAPEQLARVVKEKRNALDELDRQAILLERELEDKERALRDLTRLAGAVSSRQARETETSAPILPPVQEDTTSAAASVTAAATAAIAAGAAASSSAPAGLYVESGGVVSPVRELRGATVIPSAVLSWHEDAVETEAGGGAAALETAETTAELTPHAEWVMLRESKLQGNTHGSDSEVAPPKPQMTVAATELEDVTYIADIIRLVEPGTGEIAMLPTDIVDAAAAVQLDSEEAAETPIFAEEMQHMPEPAVIEEAAAAAVAETTNVEHAPAAETEPSPAAPEPRAEDEIVTSAPIPSREDVVETLSASSADGAAALVAGGEVSRSAAALALAAMDPVAAAAVLRDVDFSTRCKLLAFMPWEARQALLDAITTDVNPKEIVPSSPRPSGSDAQTQEAKPAVAQPSPRVVVPPPRAAPVVPVRVKAVETVATKQDSHRPLVARFLGSTQKQQAAPVAPPIAREEEPLDALQMEQQQQLMTANAKRWLPFLVLKGVDAWMRVKGIVVV